MQRSAMVTLKCINGTKTVKKENIYIAIPVTPNVRGKYRTCRLIEATHFKLTNDNGNTRVYIEDRFKVIAS